LAKSSAGLVTLERVRVLRYGSEAPAAQVPLSRS
jgi:hypothetical protein